MDKPLINKIKNFFTISKNSNPTGNPTGNSIANYTGNKTGNSIANPTINTSGESSGLKTGLLVLLFLIIGFLVIYLTIMSLKYLTTKCLNKKSYGDYIIGFNYNNICKIPYNPVTISNNCSHPSKSKELPSTNPNSILIHEKNIPPHSNPTDPVVEINRNDLEGPEQVFHISNQQYTYAQAKCKCDSYNAKLASYPQIVDAYNKGADWCSYGWGEGQTAYYPTQKCTWEKKSKKDKEACGKPGVNGGFFPDAKLKFGVNCYGKKPEGKIIKMKDPTCGSTAEEGDGNGVCGFSGNYNASHRLETDEISPFNETTWSA
jgi:hypothetical protein